MKINELVTLALAVLPWAVQAQPFGNPHVSSAIRWVDRNGLVVGTAAPVVGGVYSSSGGTFTGGVMVPVNGTTVIFPLTGGDTVPPLNTFPRGMSWLGGDVYYGQPNCVGTSYLRISDAMWGSSRVTSILKTALGNYVGYVSAAANLTPGAVTTWYSRKSASGVGACDNYTAGGDYLIPVESTIDLDSMGKPPFYLR